MTTRLLLTAAGCCLVIVAAPFPATLAGVLVAWVLILGVELWRNR
jgi:hypothetical protein